ncbi:hypothetical protein N9M68_07255 [Candidatus Poseidonia alphae]|nr:hypothetical protein [Candidatus Poseidonia alphae]
MQEPPNPQKITFEDMISSTHQQKQPVWSQKSRTVLAHPSGRLPIQARQITWQPLAGAGSSPSPRPMSNSMRSLHQRIVRGEA